MKLIILGVLLAPILYLAFRQKKWYLYLLFGFVCFLPEQFAVRIVDGLPLVSGSRILILLVILAWFIKCWKEKKFVAPISILIYLGINLLISCFHLSNGTQEINRMFLFIFERALLVLSVAGLIESSEEFDRCMDFMILGSMVVSVIAIVQTVFEYDIASVLHLTKTFASAKVPDRMGMERAYGTFNAITFGCYCAFMLLLIYYRLTKTKKQYYSIAFAVTFVAMFCTLTRGAWLGCAATFFLLAVICKGKPIIRLLPSAGIAILLCVCLCFAQPKLYKAIVETGKSSVNTVISVIPDSVWEHIYGPQLSVDPTEPSTDPTEPSEDTGIIPGETVPGETIPGETVPGETIPGETVPGETVPGETVPEETTPTETRPVRPAFKLDKNFGLNANSPVNSRTQQWSALKYMDREGHLILGYGYNAYLDGKIHYRNVYLKRWVPAHAVDVGFVALFAESGLVGFLSLMGLLGYMVIAALRRRSRAQEFDFYGLTLFVILQYLILNVASAYLNAPIIWLFFALFYAYQKLENYPCDKCIRLPRTKQ